jgi:hypothetical protein
MRKQQALLKEHFEKLGGKVTFQEFEAQQVSQPNKIPMTNIIVAWNPNATRRILLSTHYDTRPIADQEPDRRNWTKTFVSANDGTCGVAWMMELAHHMKDLSLNGGVDLVIFDGEETIYDNERDQYFFGSKHFAQQYREGQRQSTVKYQYAAGVLLDLFAGKNAKIKADPISLRYAGAIVDDIWRTARQLGVKEFVAEEGPPVEDDHVALNEVGIPTVDMIDFGYNHWHRLSDLPENCSEDSMAAMAKVLTVWMQHVK